MRWPRTLVLLTLVTASAACEADDDDGAGPTPTPTPSLTITISGTTVNYFTGATISGALVATEGLPTEAGTVSDSDGAFSFTALEGAPFDIVASGVVNHRATLSHEIESFSDISDLDVPMLSSPDVTRQYNSVGQVPTFGLGVVIVDLVSPAGAPLEDIPLADILMLDTSGAAVGLGPYFFGAAGDMVSQASLPVSTAFSGRARVGFLEVPDEPVFVHVTWSSSGTPTTVTVPATIPGAEGVALRGTYSTPTGVVPSAN